MLALTLGSDHTTVLGTSLCSMIPPSMTGLWQHYRLRNIDPRLGAGLMLGTGLGGYLGSHVALEAPKGLLELFFSIGMLFLGLKTVRL